jgi:hypothetical protein
MKNLQIINKLLAKERGWNENLIESVNSFFWKELRRKLSGFESTSIAIKHIGTITTSKRKLDYLIRKLIYKIRNIRKSNRYKESTKALLLEFNFDKLKKALVQRNILATQYYENYAKRTSRIRKTTSDNSEECRSDIGGNNQPSEAGIEYFAGGRATRDSEKEIDLLDMPIF